MVQFIQSCLENTNLSFASHAVGQMSGDNTSTSRSADALHNVQLTRVKHEVALQFVLLLRCQYTYISPAHHADMNLQRCLPVEPPHSYHASQHMLH